MRPVDGQALRVLHLSTRFEGGIAVIASMIEAGLDAQGVASTQAVLIPKGASRIGALRATARALWMLLTGRYDAVFAYQSAASLLMAVVGTMARIPLRAAHLTALPEGLKPRWIALDAFAGRMGLYTHIVANCRATADAYAQYPKGYRARIDTLAHGVSPLQPSAAPIDWRVQLALEDDAPLLVATGRLADQKDHATAIRALPRVPDAHLAIAGDGPLRDALLALGEAEGVAERLHLVGPLPRAALYDLVTAADAYVFPSVWESFGLAGAEALMAGTPVVASDLAVLREVLEIEDVANGMVRFHPVGDVKALAKAVRETIAKPLPGRTRIQAGRIAAAHHSPARMARLYAKLLAETRRSRTDAAPLGADTARGPV